MIYGLSEGHKRVSLYDVLSGSATSYKRLSTPTFIPLWIHKIYVNFLVSINNIFVVQWHYATASEDNTLRDLHDSSDDDTKAECHNCFLLFIQNNSLFKTS